MEWGVFFFLKEFMDEVHSQLFWGSRGGVSFISLLAGVLTEVLFEGFFFKKLFKILLLQGQFAHIESNKKMKI